MKTSTALIAFQKPSSSTEIRWYIEPGDIKLFIKKLLIIYHTGWWGVSPINHQKNFYKTHILKYFLKCYL